MILLHGWLCVNEVFTDEDGFPSETINRIRCDTDDIAGKFADENAGNPNMKIHREYCNGYDLLTVNFSSNHRTAETDAVIAAFTDISRTAAGTYGLIYLRDDESRLHGNEFEVFVFRNGQCFNETDSFLSPCIPVIEGNEKER